MFTLRRAVYTLLEIVVIAALVVGLAAILFSLLASSGMMV